MHGGSPLNNNGVIVGSSAPGSLNSLTLLSQLASAGTTLPGGMTLAAFGQQLTVPGTDGKLVIPSAGYILNMLATDSNVNVLSTPTILTTDNQDAEIQVGQEIPIPVGQTVATGGLSSVSIDRETVGIKLRITPQICESGTIRMDIAVETSSAVPSSLGSQCQHLGRNHLDQDRVNHGNRERRADHSDRRPDAGHPDRQTVPGCLCWGISPCSAGCSRARIRPRPKIT